ncbi:MAG: hypothetical protein Q9166_001348 [cf. Caloplaca sp. 2 TL-2023]
MSLSRRSQILIRNREVRWAVRIGAIPVEDIAYSHPSIVEPETQPDTVTQQQEQDKADRGARTAENVRYGQTISEGGMGGKTTEAGGQAKQRGYGSTDLQAAQDTAEETRQEQGYGPGSGVGA